MDLIGFVTTWFWYVMAFCAGMLVAWLVARQVIPAQTPQEAIDLALADRDERPARRTAGDRDDDADLDEEYDDTAEVQR